MGVVTVGNGSEKGRGDIAFLIKLVKKRGMI